MFCVMGVLLCGRLILSLVGFTLCLFCSVYCLTVCVLWACSVPAIVCVCVFVL